jgi:hypothetical protein
MKYSETTHTDRYQVRDRRIELALISGLFVVIFLLSFFTRLVPAAGSDNGIFQSVADRMLAGDHLYVDVYDNKDPLFYYMVAGQRLIGPIGQYLFELAAVFGSSWLTAMLAKRFETSLTRLEFAAICLCAAFVLTGWFYRPGMPATPALFFAVVAFAAAFSNRYFLAGLAIVFVFFTNVLLFPSAVWFVAVYSLLHAHLAKQAPWALLRAMAGAVIALCGGLVALAMRHELAGYVAVLESNFIYTQDNWAHADSLLGSIENHLTASLYFGANALIVSVAATGSLIWLGLKTAPDRTAFKAACLSAASLFPLLVIESALVVSFPQHLAPWELLILLALILAVPKLARTLGWRFALAGLVVVTLLAVPLMREGWPLSDPRAFGGRIRALQTMSPEIVLLNRISGGRPLSYARLGQNEQFDQAFGTAGYQLKCADIAQYPFYAKARLRRILDCATTADAVIIDLPEMKLDPRPFWLPPGARTSELNARWAWFEQEIGVAFSTGYSCIQNEPALRVCRRTNAAPRG